MYRSDYPSIWCQDSVHGTSSITSLVPDGPADFRPRLACNGVWTARISGGGRHQARARLPKGDMENEKGFGARGGSQLPKSERSASVEMAMAVVATELKEHWWEGVVGHASVAGDPFTMRMAARHLEPSALPRPDPLLGRDAEQLDTPVVEARLLGSRCGLPLIRDP